MIISSRTPEGDPNRCPICNKDTLTDPSTVPVRDAPCPHCGHLLWFVDPWVRSASPISYETFVVRVGEEYFGQYPVELRGALYACFSVLVRQGRAPQRSELTRLIATAESWPDVLRQLQLIARRHGWAYSAGAFVRRQIDRVFAPQRSEGI